MIDVLDGAPLVADCASLKVPVTSTDLPTPRTHRTRFGGATDRKPAAISAPYSSVRAHGQLFFIDKRQIKEKKQIIQHSKNTHSGYIIKLFLFRRPQ